MYIDCISPIAVCNHLEGDFSKNFCKAAQVLSFILAVSKDISSLQHLSWPGPGRSPVKLLTVCCAILLLALTVSSCNYADFTAKKTDSLTLWHNYGGQLKETMDSLVDEFNETVGLKEGILLTVTSVSDMLYNLSATAFWDFIREFKK